MSEKTEQLIRELADKLGTTTEHLWGVMVRQATISGLTDLALVLLVLVATAALFVVTAKKTRTPAKTESDKYPKPEWEDEAAIAAWTISIIFMVVAVVTILIAAGSITAALLNPEYWALKQLLNTL
jgi:ABC-type Fe3+ transport system permease subunit